MGRKSILVVDDSAVLRTMLGKALSGSGYAVSTARNGTEAMTWIAQNPQADIIITDLHMPGLDGIGLIEEIRSRAEYRHTPIFVLTAGAADDEKRLVRQAGATAWIVKPFDAEKLVRAIHQVEH